MTTRAGRPPRLAALLITAGLALGWPAAALANGSYTHVHISQLAWRMLPAGPVRELLDDPELQRACEQGSMFPDSGYAVSEPYGEHAHWEPFAVDYIEDLRARYGGDFASAEARREVAFLLGIVSHGMADQTYDTTLLARAFEVDGGEAEGFSVDQYADYFLVVGQDVRFTVAAWAPYAALSPLLERSEGHAITVARLEEAMGLMERLTRVQSSSLVAEPGYWDAWDHYPWLGSHVYDEVAVGSLPWMAALVADYWQVIWRRLTATDDPDDDLVLRTVPADGQENWPVAPAESEALAKVGIWFGSGVRRDDTTPLLSLRGPDGAPVAVRYRTPYGGSDRSVIFMVPEAPLAYATTYTIELEPGVSTLGGRTSTRPFLASFRTRCDDAHLADCPPLPPPLVTGEVPMRPGRADGGPVADAATAADAETSRDAGADGAPGDAGAPGPTDAGRPPRRDDGSGCAAGAGPPRPAGAAEFALGTLAGLALAAGAAFGRRRRRARRDRATRT